MIRSRCTSFPGGPIACLLLVTVTAAGCSSSPGWFDDGADGSPETTTDNQPSIEPQTASTADAVVIRVIDGDSLEVDQDGREIEVRLSAFNAPELYRPSVEGSDVRTCQGDGARKTLESLAPPGADVLLVPGLNPETDRFGRTLADLTVRDEPDEHLVQSVVSAMVGDGWGFATGDRLELRELMKRAAEDRRGMWGDACGPPSTAAVELGRMQPDAPGDDRFNLTEEWVEIVNTGSSDVDLSGWMIRDDTTGHRFVLDRVIPAGGGLLIRTGSGDDENDILHLDERFPVWSNERETVVLVDDNGVFVDWRFLDP